MEETIKRILPLADFCKEKGITDMEKFRKEMKPFKCIFKIRGVDYYSTDAYDQGIQKVFETRRANAESGEKRAISEYSRYKRIITASPKWIENTEAAISKEEEAYGNSTDPDCRYKIKQKLTALRSKLARQKAALADSQAAMKKLLDNSAEELNT